MSKKIDVSEMRYKFFRDGELSLDDTRDLLDFAAAVVQWVESAPGAQS